MKRKIVCIECPNGCILNIEIEDGHIVKVEGNQCEKGEKYATTEVENPLRILTSTVLTEDLHIKMLPVRTDKPIPKDKLFDAMKEIKKIRIKSPVNPGDIIEKNFLGLDVNLIVTRKS